MNSHWMRGGDPGMTLFPINGPDRWLERVDLGYLSLIL